MGLNQKTVQLYIKEQSIILLSYMYLEQKQAYDQIFIIKSCTISESVISNYTIVIEPLNHLTPSAV